MYHYDFTKGGNYYSCTAITGEPGRVCTVEPLIGGSGNGLYSSAGGSSFYGSTLASPPSPRGIDAVIAGVSGLTSSSSMSSHLAPPAAPVELSRPSHHFPTLIPDFSPPPRSRSPSPETKAYKEDDAGAGLFKKREYMDAIEKYKSAIEHKPGECYFYTNIAQCYNLMGQYREAISWTQKAFDRKPNYEHARVEKARALVGLGDKDVKSEKFSAALSLYQEASELLKPGGEGAGTTSKELTHKIETAQQEKRTAETKQWYEKEADRYKDQSIALFFDGNYQDSLTLVEAAKSQSYSPDRFTPLLDKIIREIKADEVRKEADALVSEKKYTDAEAKYREAKDLSEHKPERFDAGITEVTRLVAEKEKAEAAILTARLEELAKPQTDESRHTTKTQEVKEGEHIHNHEKHQTIEGKVLEYCKEKLSDARDAVVVAEALNGIARGDGVAQPSPVVEFATKGAEYFAKSAVDQHEENTKAEGERQDQLYARQEKKEGEHVCLTTGKNVVLAIAQTPIDAEPITSVTKAISKVTEKNPHPVAQGVAKAATVATGVTLATVGAKNVVKELESDLGQECIGKIKVGVKNVVSDLFTDFSEQTHSFQEEAGDSLLGKSGEIFDGGE